MGLRGLELGGVCHVGFLDLGVFDDEASMSDTVLASLASCMRLPSGGFQAKIGLIGPFLASEGLSWIFCFLGSGL